MYFNVAVQAAYCAIPFKKIQVYKNLSFNFTTEAAYCD
jgi:hypothetical protein